MRGMKDIILTILGLFSFHSSPHTVKYTHNGTVLRIKTTKAVPLHITNQLKQSNQHLKTMLKNIETLPKDQQYILKKIYDYCVQIFELVRVCPKSYECLRSFFNGYLQSLSELIQEFAYLSNQQNRSIEMEEKIDVCLNSLQQTKQHLADLFHQGLLTETEGLYQRIHQLNHLMHEDIKGKGDIILLDERKRKTPF